MNTKTKIVLSIILALVIAIVFLQYQVNKTEKELEKKKLEAAYNYQNFQAWKDSSMMKANTLQEYAIAVRNLKDENKKLKQENVFLKSQFTLLLDSIEVLNKPATVDTTDSSRIVIEFEGEQGRITYKGQVIYFKLNKTATHSLKINQSPIKITSIFELDPKTNLITNKIYTDGVLIDDAYTVIDSLIYRKLNTPEGMVDAAVNFWDKINLIIEANQEIKMQNEIWKQNRTSVNLGLGYNVTETLSFEVKKDILNNIWNANARFSITPYKIWNIIF